MDYFESIDTLREDIIKAIRTEMQKHDTDSVTIPEFEEIGEGAYVIWYNKNGEACECEVRKVDLSCKGLRLYAYDRYADYDCTLYTEYDYGARELQFLATIHDLVYRILNGEI